MIEVRLKWLSGAENIRTELKQSSEEGKNISAFKEKAEEIIKIPYGDHEREKIADGIYDMLSSTPIVTDYKYVEPSDLQSIQSQRPIDINTLGLPSRNLSDEELFDKMYGAWLGRCVGCLLGQPIEGWKRDRIVGLLKDTNNYPINYYISSDIPKELRSKYEISDEGGVYGNKLKAWINNVSSMPEDDDTNYTVLGLKIIEEYGAGFTPVDVAESWLLNLPIFHTCTAERVAYKNISNGILPPHSASFRNPYREWIGAQIRADFFGYVTPGNPELGADMAWRDASISHVKNGIYGEMFVAAMLSAAAVTSDINKIVECGLSQIPKNSRLTEAIRLVQGWKSEGKSWEQALNKIHEIYDENNPHEWCHTISNAMIVCAGLIYGDLDLEKSVGIAVMAAFDTDCNGATVGSIVGLAVGSKILPEKWISPLNDRIKSGVDGMGLVKISDLAKTTVDIIKKIKITK